MGTLIPTNLQVAQAMGWEQCPDKDRSNLWYCPITGWLKPLPDFTTWAGCGLIIEWCKKNEISVYICIYTEEAQVELVSNDTYRRRPQVKSICATPEEALCKAIVEYKEKTGMKLTKEEGINVVYGDSDEFETVKGTRRILDTSRWSIIYECVYLHKSSGKHYLLDWSQGATESQDEGPFEYSEPNPIEVEPKEVMVTKWVPVSTESETSNV